MRFFYLFFILILGLTPLCIAQKDPFHAKNNNLKITLLSLISGSTKITYERKTFPYQSIEITGGIIGAGFDLLNHNQSKGSLYRLAYKFIFHSKKQFPLEGWYIKPELAFSSYRYNYINDLLIVERLMVNRLAIMSVGGYELIRKWFVFDIFAGMGFAVGNANHSNYHHGYIGLNADSDLAFTAGFKVGVAF
ncbi:MAG: hypothetical protein PHX62_08645 [Bacilli bacterium]|nr:hypothetical protein [Bacilli bacterium]